MRNRKRLILSYVCIKMQKREADFCLYLCKNCGNLGHSILPFIFVPASSSPASLTGLIFKAYPNLFPKLSKCGPCEFDPMLTVISENSVTSFQLESYFHKVHIAILYLNPIKVVKHRGGACYPLHFCTLHPITPHIRTLYPI